MSRYRGPRLRIVRRLGNLSGLTRKSSKKLSRPGQHGKMSGSDMSKKITDYGVRLEEKQSLKFNYGLTESQLFSYVKKARNLMGKGISSVALLKLLEMRLDAICFNLGFAPTIPNARQLVNHRHVKVNGKVVDIASFQCREGDVISIDEKIYNKQFINHEQNKGSINNQMEYRCPLYLELDKKKTTGTILNNFTESTCTFKINQLVVIEYYSRR